MINGFTTPCSLGSLCVRIKDKSVSSIYRRDLFPCSCWVTIYKTEPNFQVFYFAVFTEPLVRIAFIIHFNLTTQNRSGGNTSGLRNYWLHFFFSGRKTHTLRTSKALLLWSDSQEKHNWSRSRGHLPKKFTSFLVCKFWAP